jgi:two-component system nitrogen regulation response regulator GlnG
MARLLVIDDEPSICWGLAQWGRRQQHEVVAAATAEEGLSLARGQPPELIFLDVRLPGMDGLSALERFREQCPQARVIVMTAYGDLPTAVQTVRRGAWEYLPKPFDLARVEQLVARALSEPAAASLPEVLPAADGLVGRSPAMQEVFKRIAQVAATEAGVLLVGESGTGKELVARAIHRYSRRKEGPLVSVNLAALSPTLAESELFGHVRGAFTGADQPRQGLLVAADGGTLLLDEVADIPPAIQVKLLRAVEYGEVWPVGAGRPVQTRLRTIAATHQDLADSIRRGTFRHDLYFRLATFVITLPPLRQRREDIPLLVNHFVSRLAGAGSEGLVSAAAMEELTQRPWYGNVRELRNAVEHALIVAQGDTIRPEHLPPALPHMGSVARSEAEPSMRPGASLAPPQASAPGAGMSLTPAEAFAASPPAAEGRALLAQEAGELTAAVQRWAQSRLAEGAAAASVYDELLALVEPPLLVAALQAHRGQCAPAARTLGLHRVTLKRKLEQYGLAAEE